MKRILSVLAAAALFSTLALAADAWTGKLIDATCHSQQQQTKSMSCDATSATTAFALDVQGQVYNLDAAGNKKAQAALKSRADRSTNPGQPANGPVTAKVTGTEKGGTITVDTLDVQ